LQIPQFEEIYKKNSNLQDLLRQQDFQKQLVSLYTAQLKRAKV